MHHRDIPITKYRRDVNKLPARQFVRCKPTGRILPPTKIRTALGQNAKTCVWRSTRQRSKQRKDEAGVSAVKTIVHRWQRILLGRLHQKRAWDEVPNLNPSLLIPIQNSRQFLSSDNMSTPPAIGPGFSGSVLISDQPAITTSSDVLIKGPSRKESTATTSLAASEVSTRSANPVPDERGVPKFHGVICASDRYRFLQHEAATGKSVGVECQVLRDEKSISVNKITPTCVVSSISALEALSRFTAALATAPWICFGKTLIHS